MEISYTVNEINKRYELRILRIDDEIKLRSVYNSSKFESEQFIRFVFSILNVNSKKKKETLFINIGG